MASYLPLFLYPLLLPSCQQVEDLRGFHPLQMKVLHLLSDWTLENNKSHVTLKHETLTDSSLMLDLKTISIFHNIAIKYFLERNSSIKLA